MDQMVQLQQQIQRLQQEVNSINQVCNQLQQSEQANALQLQQMTQKEFMAAQGLRRIQQAASQLSQEINQISNITQQIASQVAPFQRPFQGVGTGLGTYSTYTGLTGQTTGWQPQAGYGTNWSTIGTGALGGGQYGTFGGQYGTFGQGTSQYGFNQGQNLGNIGPVPGINLSTFTSQLHPYSQGYIPGQFGTGNQFGYSSQAFSGAGANQFGAGAQGVSGMGGGQLQPGTGGTQGQMATFGGAQPFGSSQGLAGFTGNRGIPATQLLDVIAPVMQNTGLGMAGSAGSQGYNQTASFGQGNLGLTGIQGSNPGASFGQGNLGTGTGIASYSPYQANQFGFR
ncbi:MAG: hypothetical protein ACOY40_11480 [Bacillota bacterium]